MASGLARIALVVVVASLAAGTGCKKKKAADGAGSGSDVASGSATTTPAATDAAAMTPPPATIDAATPAPPTATVDAAAGAQAPADPPALAAVPAPAEDCDGAKCTELAGGHEPTDPQRAALFKHGCVTGDSRACALLAVTFDQGVGVGKDLRTAAVLYDRACGMKDLTSCHRLGTMLLYGTGTRPDNIDADPDRAIGLLDGACKAQLWPACTSLGDYYMANSQRDKALPIYRVACDHKDKPSCDALAKVN